MVFHDRRGLAVTTESREAGAQLDAAVSGFLAHRLDTGEHLAAALAADGDLVLGLCLAGFARLLLGRAELIPEARRFSAQARRALWHRGGTARERRIAASLAAWCGEEMAESAALLDAAIDAEPLDALAFKLSQATHFMLGNARAMRRLAERAASAWSPGVPERGFILGCGAFALEERGDFAAAERTGRLAVELEPRDAWGRHAVAHVMHVQGRIGEGIAWLAAHDRDGLNNFAYHLDWHLALFHLAKRDPDAALELYDRKVRAVRTDDYRDIANAASLLARLEWQGAAVGDRWDELADIAERRIADDALVFARLHYLICLVRARRPQAARAMLGEMQRQAGARRGTQGRVLGTVGLPLAAAICEDGAGPQFLPDAERLAAIGGSRVQRSLFEHWRAPRQHPAAKRPDSSRAAA
jgi:hypothetical protein